MALFSLRKYMKYWLFVTAAATPPGCRPAATLPTLAEGSPATDAVRQATVGLRNAERIICSGVLVASDLVVTAAHCLEDAKEVVFATVAPGHREERKIRWMKRFKEDGRSHAPNFDIAVVRFQGSLPRGFRPVEVMPPAQLKPGSSVVVAGLGDTNGNGDAGHVLESRSRFTRAIDSAQFFNLLLLDSKGGTCEGDSGGPAFVMQKGRLKLLGIAQGFFSPLTPVPTGRCATGPVLYTAVDDYVSWIRQQTGVQIRGGATRRALAVASQRRPGADLKAWCRYANHFDEAWFTFQSIVRASLTDLPLEYQRDYLASASLLGQHLASTTSLRLQGFSFEGSQAIRTLTPIETMPQLERLELTGHEITDLTPLAQVTSLQTLTITHNQRNQTLLRFPLTPLQRLPFLHNLDLSYNSPPGQNEPFLADFSGLPSSLTRITAADSLVSSLRGLGRLSRLEEIAIDDTIRPGFPRDLAAIAGLARLRHLTLAGGPLVHPESLAQLKGLTSLDLQRSDFRDTAPLAGLGDLRFLDLSRTQAADITPLAVLPLEQLSLRDTRVNPESCRLLFADRSGICQF